MENQMSSPTASTKPRRRLKPEVVARFNRPAQTDLSQLYAKPLEQLTERELRQMKQAFLSGI